MNEKKANGFAALLLTVVVAGGAVAGVKFAGGSAAPAPGADASSAPGVYEAAAPGIYNTDVKVTLTIGNDGTIADVQIDASGETPEYGGAAAEPLREKILKAQSADIDVVSGSTVTSNAVITAAAACLEQAAGGGASLAAGTYEQTVQGFNGEVTVTITVDGDGKIADVQIGVPNETPAYADEVVEKVAAAILESQSADVDVTTKSTITKEAVLEAARACLLEAAGK